MERKERTKDVIVPLNSLSKHSRELKSHEQEMAELVCKTQLSSWTAHKLKQEWCSELDSSSDFDSVRGSWRDEDIAPDISGESRLLSPVNTHRIEILQNSILGKEFQNVHSDDGESLSSFVETVREDTNDSSVFEGSTLADEETHLDLQNRHVEAFYHESQDMERGFLPLHGWRKAQYITYKREYTGLLETEGQEVEPKHPLAFDESSTKDSVFKRSSALGASAALNSIDLHTTESRTICKPPIVERNGVTVHLGISSSASTVSKDTCLTSEVNSVLNRGRKNPGLKELSQTLEAMDINESNVDTLHDMEEVLFDSGENNGAGFVCANRGSLLQSPKTYWKSGSNASDSHNLCQQNLSFQKIDSVEVVGAKHRKGGASLGEKLVGLKEYMVYQIRVRSERNEWEIEQRYRDFIHLYHELKGMFVAQNDIQLPSPWENVEKESRKIFSIASNLVEERSLLIEECLSSLLEAGAPFDTAPPLLLFLLPKRKSHDTTPASEDKEYVNMEKVSGEKGSSFNFQNLDKLLPIFHSGKIRHLGKQSEIEEISAFGKTIRLNLQIHPCKPFKQLLESQHYLCAGCYKQLDVANSLIEGFVQNIISSKPRLCEYMGQLFCTSCHSNETAVLPAWVLQLWDFTPRPVSQLAKTYLDSIYEQPMLCVSAINPYILSKAPVLVHAMEMRKKLSKMFACIRCPARASIHESLGSRRYLLESSDFFALRDLVDLSKGAFSDLLIMMEDMLKKIHIHITQLCSTCHLEAESCGVC